MSTLDRLIKQMEQQEGLPPIPAGKKGEYNLPIEEEISVRLYTNQAGGISMVSEIDASQTAKKGEFFTHLLGADLFFQGTSDAVIGLDKTGKNIVISRHFADNITYNQFLDVFEDFVNTVTLWKDETKNFV